MRRCERRRGQPLLLWRLIVDPPAPYSPEPLRELLRCPDLGVDSIAFGWQRLEDPDDLEDWPPGIGAP